MDIGNSASDYENDGIIFDLSRKIGNLTFDSATISTAASFQSYDSTFLHDQISPILGIESQIPEININKRNREFNTKKIEKKSDSNSINSQFSISKSKNLNDDRIELNEQKEPCQVSNFINDAGIKILFRNLSDSEKMSSNALSTKINQVLVNGIEVEVIPSVKTFKDKNLNFPSNFKTCDELVKYYIGKVLRSSNSLYYIEKKLQQALYGAVFLAYELKEQNQDVNIKQGSILKFTENSGKSEQSINKIGKICYKFDRKNKVAIKVSSMSLRRRKPSLKEDIEAEVLYSQSMKGHKNVLEYSEIWQDSFKNIYVKMEFAEFEDLFEVMRRRKRPLTENEARWLFSQIFSAVIHLHNNEMAMRDLSLENILMFNREPHFFDDNEEFDFIGVIKPGDTLIVPKITDPGQACKIKLKKDQNSNSCLKDKIRNRDSGFQLQKVEFLFGKSFRPPEAYLIGSLYDPTKVDVFCLGWMLLYTLTKYQPFETCRLITEPNTNQNKNEGFINNFFSGIINNTHKVHENSKKMIAKDENWSYIINGKIQDLFKKIKANKLSDQVLHLVENMLLPDYKERFSMKNVINHPWLKHQINKESVLYTPIMSSSLLQKKINKTSNNIFKPSNFFGDHNKDLNKKHLENQKNSEAYFNESNRVKNKEKVGDIRISKVNNEYLNSMVKRTNEKLKMTRITIVKRKDSEIEILTTNMNKNSTSETKSLNKYNPSLEEIANLKKSNNLFEDESNACKNKFNNQGKKFGTIDEVSVEYNKIRHINNLRVDKTTLNSNLNNAISVSNRRKGESNIFSEIWSFFVGGNNK